MAAKTPTLMACDAYTKKMRELGHLPKVTYSAMEAAVAPLSAEIGRLRQLLLKYEVALNNGETEAVLNSIRMECRNIELPSP